MAKPTVGNKNEKINSLPHRRTSIGSSPNTRPTNKQARRMFKKSRGQGS